VSARPASVWIVNQYAQPRGSAGITRHGDLASVLHQLGHEVTVIASGYHYFREAGLSAERHGVKDHDGVRFVWLDTSPYQKNDYRRVLNMVEFYLRAIAAKLNGVVRPPDVVIGSSPHLLCGLAGLALAKRYRAKFVLELRDVWPDDLVAMGALREGGVMHGLLQRLALHLERRADRIITVPPKLAAHMAARGVPPQKLVHVPNGVFLDETATDPGGDAMPATLRAELEALEGSFVVMYMGAHGQANGLHNVLDAAKLLAAGRGDVPVAFVLIGAGQQKEELVERARNEGITNVRFHDPIPKAAVQAAAHRADALMVHLAPVDTFDAYGRSPNKLYDYLATGKPVLYSTTDPATIIDTAHAGLTFAPGQPQALADAVVRLAHMPASEREEMGRRGRAALVGQHDLAALGAKLSQLVDELGGSSDQ
jgi:glycosyltransferase involved in cell wall biosynthesis